MDKITKTLAVLLFISLGANFLLGGMMLAQKMSSPQKPDILAAGGFSKKDQEILKESMHDTRKKMSAVRKDLEDIRKDVKAAMHAEPFDQETLDEALRMEKEKKAEILAIMRGARDDVMQRLSPEGRQAIQKMAPKSSGYIVKMRGRPSDDDDFPLMWEEWDDVPPSAPSGTP